MYGLYRPTLADNLTDTMIGLVDRNILECSRYRGRYIAAIYPDCRWLMYGAFAVRLNP